MPRVLALVPTDLQLTRFGLPARLADALAGRPVLAHTVARLARIDAVAAVVLVHPAGQSPLALLAGQDFGKPVLTHADPAGLVDAHTTQRRASRRWTPTAWRGGFGGATCYDELLPAGPLLAALEAHGGDAALLAGADWPLIDPVLSQQVLALHLGQPEAMPLTFSLAPPGLCGLAIARDLLRQLAEKNGGIGQTLAYNPTRAQPDPIGRDVCVQVPVAISACAGRFIYDTPRAGALLDRLAATLGASFASADAAAVTAAATRVLCDPEAAAALAPLPPLITLELTPQRPVTGPITPQHHVALPRAPMPLDLARHLVAQIGRAGAGEVALLLGGLGDALLHPHWQEVVEAAHAAGVRAIGIETDLLVDEAMIDRLLDLPLDLLSVRVNADGVDCYRQVMGRDGFALVGANLQRLLVRRRQARLDPLLAVAQVGMPWVLPRLIKTADTLADLEGFFDRWTYFAGHAVIEPATSGCGLMPEQSPVNMAPPRRLPCRQLERRLTVHADGKVALCDQDWLARAAVGDAATTPLSAIWKALNATRAAHRAGRWDELPLCRACHEWHRP